MPPRCPNCDHPLTGPYCSQCGEAQHNPDDLKLQAFILKSATTLLDLERGLLGSLLRLVTKPGQLTQDFLQGRRKSQVHPFRLFLVINVLYFFLQPVLLSNTYNTRLRGHMERQYYSPQVQHVVAQTLATRGIDFATYAEEFDKATSKLTSIFIVTLVPLLALLTAFFFRKAKLPAVGHLVFGLHFFSFFLLLGSIGLGLVLQAWYQLWKAMGWGVPSLLGEITLSTSMLLIAMSYLQPAIRRVFQKGAWSALGLALVLGLLIFPILITYRFGLFWVTWVLV